MKSTRIVFTLSLLFLFSGAFLGLTALSCKSYKTDPVIRENLAALKTKRDAAAGTLKTPSGKPALTGSQPPSGAGKGSASKKSASANQPLKTTLSVANLGLHTGVELFDQTSLIIQSPGKSDTTRTPYKLGDEIPIIEGQTYTNVVRLYSKGKLVYSSEFCQLDNSFVTKAGHNIFAIPVCRKGGAASTAKP
ncbi:MAG: hypothetical protein H7249_14935 [Chitinophagaceae bacterium]|nr:hypothetical protein [Oligoflexus sp.]